MAKKKKEIIIDDSINLLVESTKDKFINGHIKENKIFKEIAITTCTAQANITNVQFHEKDLQPKIKLFYPLPIAYSNYGTTYIGDYVPYVKVKKTLRGRKKKEKKKSNRKVQGNGKHFNSQITIEMISEFCIEDENNEIKIRRDDFIKDFIQSNKERTQMKFKVFRTGKIQLPGLKPNIINKVIYGLNQITEILDKTLYYDNDGKLIIDEEEYKPPELEYMIIDMINYKFVYRHITESDQIINLQSVMDLVLNTGWVFRHNVSLKSVLKNFDSRKLSIIFDAPNPKKDNGEIRVIIFPRGKINMLGVFDIEQSKEVYSFISFIFEKKDDIIINIIE